MSAVPTGAGVSLSDSSALTKPLSSATEVSLPVSEGIVATGVAAGLAAGGASLPRHALTASASVAAATARVLKCISASLSRGSGAQVCGQPYRADDRRR